MRLSWRSAVVLSLLAALTSCARAQARVPPAVPGLATPDPPERLIVPVTIVEVPEPPAVPQPAPSTPARTPVRPERPVGTATTSPPAPTASEPAPPPPVLQMTTNPAELEQRASASIAQTKRDLERVPLQQLSANARSIYDDARGFIRQAEKALTIKNVVLAKELADRAAALASQLAKR
jgi:hypothetical protein